MPKVSVIIPAYNAMTFLPITLENVLQQTWQDFEVVIINDGSRDNLLEWTATLNDPRIKVFSQNNQGLAAARNSGIRFASGEYLAFLDADDLWRPTKLAQQVEVLDQNPTVGLVYTGVESINAQGESTGRTYQRYVRGQVWQSLITHNVVECGSNALVRRVCFSTCGEFDSTLGSAVEDWDMWLRIARHYEFESIPELLVLYRQHTGSASKNWPAMEASFRRVIDKAFAAAPPEEQPLKVQAMGFAYLCLAWQPLQAEVQDVKQAIAFQHQAKVHDPHNRYAKEIFWLTLAIRLAQVLGTQGYQSVLSRGRSVRRQLRSLARSTS
jgi:glycosyltransferase involved in cell wall biosynthesis